MEMQSLNFTSKFANFEVVNEEMTRCRCYMLATGKNVNGSNITYEAVQKAIDRNEFANKCVVAHLYKDEENGRYRVGGHDSKWIISNQGIEIVNECIPFGLIPESANVHFEEVLEPDGVTKNNYLVCDIILWTGRYNIMDAAYSYDIYFNQSCEIKINEYAYEDDGTLRIDDFTFSALCLLHKDRFDSNKDVRPCFPSCRVEKFEANFSLNENTKFAEEFNILIAKANEIYANHNDDTNVSQIKTETKEESKLNFENIIKAISSEMIPDSDVSRYAVIGCDESGVTVFDRIDYGCYTIRYTVENTEDAEKITFDFNNKIDMALSAIEKNDDCFDFKSEFTNLVDRIKEDSAVFAVKKAQAEFEIEKIEAVKEITDKYEALEKEYELLKTDKERCDAKLGEYVEAEKKAEFEAHKKEIDKVIESYESKLSNNPEFLIYKSRVDYSKSAKDVDFEMLVILGKASRDSKAEFSYKPVAWGTANFSENNEVVNTNRYGDLFVGFKN